MDVLLVEDDEFVRDCLSDMLREAGLCVTAASTPTEALAMPDATGTPTVLVADVHLGARVDGFGLAIAARRRWPGIRAVLMSGDDEITERVCASGDKFLPKPFRGADLLQAICELGELRLATSDPG